MGTLIDQVTSRRDCACGESKNTGMWTKGCLVAFRPTSSSGTKKWKDIASLSGPPGLRAIKGFCDEAPGGKWKGFRSSRLNEQRRVVADALLVQVVRVTPHDCGKS